MSRRGVRIALCLIGAAAIVWSAYSVASLERAAARLASDGRAHDAAARAALGHVQELRAAQQSYVAMGQGEGYWIARAEKLTTLLRDEITGWRPSAPADAVPSIDAAAAALDDFRQIDRRARDHARGGQHLLASDLIYTDGLEKLDAIADAIEAARARALAVDEASGRTLRRRQAMFAGGAAALALLIMALLMPVPPPAAAVVRVTSVQPAAERPVVPAPVVPPPPPSEPPRGALEVARVADLCTDFARAGGAGELLGLLERAAALLGGRGIVVWLADADRQALRPVLAHGYPSNVLGRLGVIARDADNATAVAFREARLTAVPARVGFEGAIVSPLLTPAGCIGVLAAEVREGSDASELRQSLARILAAQIAAVVGFTDPASADPADAVTSA
jgi:hypothetical protein